jgi:hypothetical protein
MYAIMRKSVRISVPWRSMGKYVLASTLTAAVLYFLPQPTTIVLTLSKVGVGVGAYALLLLAIDVEARELVASIWHEIKGIFGGFGSRD